MAFKPFDAEVQIYNSILFCFDITQNKLSSRNAVNLYQGLIDCKETSKGLRLFQKCAHYSKGYTNT